MDQSIYKRYRDHANEHWWWEARKDIFKGIIENNTQKKSNIHILDYGSGSGVYLNFLKSYGKVSAFEPDFKSLNHIKKFFNVDTYLHLGEIKEKFDIILLADVLEHIKDPNGALKQIKKFLTKDGYIIITVPAHQFLYSKKDILLQHYRRYSKNLLINQLENNNLSINYISYYNFFLSPIIVIATIIFKIIKLNHINLVEKKPNALINNILKKIFSFEGNFIKKKNKFTFWY